MVGTILCFSLAYNLFLLQTLTLEQEAYPALDELTSKISTLNLERVRQIKSRLVAISGRVQKVIDHLFWRLQHCDVINLLLPFPLKFYINYIISTRWVLSLHQWICAKTPIFLHHIWSMGVLTGFTAFFFCNWMEMNLQFAGFMFEI